MSQAIRYLRAKGVSPPRMILEYLQDEVENEVWSVCPTGRYAAFEDAQRVCDVEDVRSGLSHLSSRTGTLTLMPLSCAMHAAGIQVYGHSLHFVLRLI